MDHVIWILHVSIDLDNLNTPLRELERLAGLALCQRFHLICSEWVIGAIELQII